MEIQPTYPFFLEDVTVNRHIFLLGPTYDMLASFIGINATVNNISAISWRPVVVVEETGVPGENHRPWANNW